MEKVKQDIQSTNQSPNNLKNIVAAWHGKYISMKQGELWANSDEIGHMLSSSTPTLFLWQRRDAPLQSLPHISAGRLHNGFRHKYFTVDAALQQRTGPEEEIP